MAWGRVFSIQSGNYLMAVTRIQDQMAATRIQSASNLNSPGFPRIATFAILGFTRNRCFRVARLRHRRLVSVAASASRPAEFHFVFDLEA